MNKHKDFTESNIQGNFETVAERGSCDNNSEMSKSIDCTSDTLSKMKQVLCLCILQAQESAGSGYLLMRDQIRIQPALRTDGKFAVTAGV